MVTAYFGALDTVEFQPGAAELDRRIAESTGLMMIHMLAGGVVPVLSQTQAFDSPLILGSIQRFDDSALALLHLVRASLIQARLLDGSDDLLTAFRAALRTSTFEFSAWPELNADPALRRAVLEQLERDPGRVHLITDGPLEQRLVGLLELDQALRASTARERAQPVAGPGLADLVLADLDLLVSDLVGYPEDGPARAIGVELAAAARLAEVPPATRSAWRALVREVVPRHAGRRDLDRLVGKFDGLVNKSYNVLVGRSLGVDGLSLDAPDYETGRVLARAETQLRLGSRAVALLDEPGLGGWLTWHQVRGIIGDLGEMHPAGRLEYLVNRQTEHGLEIARSDDVGRSVWAHVKAAPINVIGGLVGGAVGLSLSDPVITLAGAAVGALVGSAANLAVEIVRQRDADRREAAARREFTARFRPSLTSRVLEYPANFPD